MFYQQLTTEHLVEMAQSLKKRSFQPGFDHMTSEAAVIWFSVNGGRLLDDIRRKRYTAQPALGFHIAKRDGNFRRLAKLTAIDTVLQYAMLSFMTPKLEKVFSDHSHAYRPQRGVPTALQEFVRYASQFTLCARIDPVACYDSIHRELLMEQVRQHFPKESELVSLIETMIEMPLIHEGTVESRKLGILQGAPLSPTLCNLYLNDLDTLLENRQIPFIRYADDILLFANSYSELQKALSLVSLYLEKNLQLKVNHRKDIICSPVDMYFLGHSFLKDVNGMISLTTEQSVNGAFYQWHQEEIEKAQKGIDILSDGILRQKDYSLLFDSEEKKINIPIRTIEYINIYASVIFDSGFLQTALEHGIYINLFDRFGKRIGNFFPAKPIKQPLVVYRQLAYYSDPEMRLSYAKQFLLASFHHCLLVLRYYDKHHPCTLYQDAIDALKAAERKIKACKTQDALMLIEAGARKQYFGCFDEMLQTEEFAFEKRSRRPPLNEVNAMISFGNTVLYQYVANAVNRSPLDIRVGYLHATTSTRENSLNLDIAEIFRPLVVDRTIFSMINRKMIHAESFEEVENGGIYLTTQGKKQFLLAFYHKLDETQTIDGKPYSYGELIREEVRKLVRSFRSEEVYRAFHQVR